MPTIFISLEKSIQNEPDNDIALLNVNITIKYGIQQDQILQKDNMCLSVTMTVLLFSMLKIS